ncbi:MAG: phage holin family protein [Pseudolabrys sp.]
MAASPAADVTESRRRSARASDKGVVDIAGEALKDVAALLQAELELLRAEISEKLTFTAVSALLIGAGALLVMATIVLLLQAAIAGLVAYGLSMTVAILVVAAATLVVGASLVWFGVNRLSLDRLTPTKTLDQLQKDSTIATQR